MMNLAKVAALLTIAVAGCGDDGPEGDPLVVWAERAGGSGWDGARAAAVDASGAIYVAGYFEQQAVFGEGQAAETTLAVAPGSSGSDRDLFLARLTADGALVWAVSAGGVGPDAAHSLAVSSDGSVWLAGVFADGAVFGAGGPQEITLSAGAGNTFLARYDGSGELLWARATAGDWSAEHGCYRVAAVALADGSVAIKGTIDGTATFGVGETGEATLTGTGPRDDFAARYDSAGALLWARHLGGSGGAGGLAVLADGRLVLSGDFEHEIVLGAGEPDEVALSSLGHRDLYLAVLEESGDLAWAERAGSSGLETTTSVAALSDGSLLLAGYFMNTVSFDHDEPSQITLESTGADTSFVARYDADGVAEWAIPLGGDGWVDACELAVLADDRFAVTGWLGDLAPATFGGGTTQELTLGSSGGEDVFVVFFDAQGIPIRGIGFGSSGNGPIDDKGLAAAPVADGSLFTAGLYEGDSVTIGGGSDPVVLPNAGGSDAFFALLRP